MLTPTCVLESADAYGLIGERAPLAGDVLPDMTHIVVRRLQRALVSGFCECQEFAAPGMRIVLHHSPLRALKRKNGCTLSRVPADTNDRRGVRQSDDL